MLLPEGVQPRRARRRVDSRERCRLLFRQPDVPRITGREVGERAPKVGKRDLLRIALRLVERGELLLAQQLELARREGRLAQQLGEQRERCRELASTHLERRLHPLGAAGEPQLDAQPVELVLDRLPVAAAAAADEHRRSQLAVERPAAEALLVAEVQRCDELHHPAARALGQQHDARPRFQGEARQARLHRRRRGVERLPLGEGRIAGVAGHHLGDRRRWLWRGVQRLLGGNEEADRAVDRAQKEGGDAAHVLDRRRPQAVAVQEHQPPVAQRRPLREAQRRALGVAHGGLPGLQARRPRPLHLRLAGGLTAGERVRLGEHRRACRREILLAAHLGREIEQARVAELERPGRGRRGQTALDQPPVEAARGSVAEHVGEQLDGGEVRVRAGGHVVSGGGELHVADPAQGDRALAVLRRLLRPGRGQLAPGRGTAPKVRATAASAWASSKRPATTSTALSGWYQRS